MNERETALARVRAALPSLQQISNLYSRANSLNQQMMARSAQADGKKGKRAAIFSVLAVIAFINIYGLLSSLVAALLYLKTRQIPIGLTLFWLLTVAVLSVLVYKTVKKKIMNKNNFSKEELDAHARQMDAISQEIYRISTENQAAIEAIPRDYRYYDAVSYIESVLENERADSMKEALNLFETHLHQRRLEANSQAVLAMNRQQCEMMEVIEQRAHNAERNSAIAATFSVLTYLSTPIRYE